MGLNDQLNNNRPIMRSHLRHLVLGIATLFCAGAMAQYPYTYVISGTITNCYPGQVVNVQTPPGTDPIYNLDVPVDSATCTFGIALGINSSSATVLLTTLCSGMVLTAADSANFGFILDSAFIAITFNCGGGGVPDCLGVPGGSALSGTPCNDGDVNTINDTWSASCVCEGDTIIPVLDCLGVLGGADMPGAPCDDGDSLTVNDIWNSACVCVGDTSGFITDCLGVPGGSDMPGTPCDDGDPLTVNDMWTSGCLCLGSSSTPCNADFWIVQAYTYDSLLGTATPIPYELWLWNLSSGGSGTYTFLWSFGDGTSSTDPFPTHNYSGSGPYVLCLTIDDGLGCVSTHCDSVSIDSAGIYSPFTGGNTQRISGFTLNVKDPDANGIAEPASLSSLTLWPNPVDAELGFTVNSEFAGNTDLSIHDMTGRVVWQGRQSLLVGRNNLSIGVEGLGAGLYVLRIGEGNMSIGQRFVKR